MAIQDEIPQSRLTLRYKTEIDGQPADITLPLRLMILGDFSLGSSVDREESDLDERRLRNLDGTNTNDVMKDMRMSLSFEVENKIDPAVETDLAVTLPIDSMKSFSPDEVAQHVPKLKGLLTLKQLVAEMLTNVNNRKELNKLLNEMMSNSEYKDKVLADLKDFEGFKLPDANT
jgi:type VI secretion system protein ImpB